MIAVLDVGNTVISIGFFTSKNRYCVRRISTDMYSRKKLRSVFKCQGVFPERCIVCSVVPRMEAHIKKDIYNCTRCRVEIVGKDIAVTIKHRYKRISALGKDRLVNIYGAQRIYRAPFVVIDFGTAITFDYVNRQNVFEGGLIAPGIITSFRALSERGALLPKNMILAKPQSFLGRMTSDGMRAGTVYGFGALIDGLIRTFRNRYGSTVRVLMTGGMAAFIRPYCRSKATLDADLTLKSLYMISANSAKKRRG